MKALMLILGMTILGCTASPQLQQYSPAIAVSDEIQNKYALVIGNAAYTTISKLKNPLNDANDMTSVLKGLGFTVDKVLDGTREEMENAVLRLKKRLSESKNSCGFLFYAGHGVQSNGQNYLIPVDANISSEHYLRDRAVPLQAVLGDLNDAGNALNIVVLDACRDNPFSWARSGSRGLVMEGGQPADSIIVYATGAGSTAADGEGRNGLFTGHLLNNLKTPGLEITEVFRLTMGNVARASNNAQRPAVYNQFPGTAYLGTRPSAPVNPPAPVTPVLQSPQNVRVGTPRTDRVTLSWDNVGTRIRYKIYLGTENDPARARALHDLSTRTSRNVTGLTGGTDYYFWVTSVQNGVESAKSLGVSVKTPPKRSAKEKDGGPYQEDIPDWFLNPPMQEDVIFGSGTAKMSDVNMSLQMAESRARQSIAFTLNANVQAMITDYSRNAGISRDLFFAETIGRQLVNTKLSGVVVYKRGMGKDGTVYVLVALRKADAAKQAADVIDSEAAQYAEYKAMNALEWMEAQLARTYIKPEPITY